MMRGLMWFRRDLRLYDNAALHHALRECERLYCCFCFDTEILDKLEDRDDRRVDFIHRSLRELDAGLRSRRAALLVRHGPAHTEIPRLARELDVECVFANHDYEPRRLERDRQVDEALRGEGRALRTFKDHVVFETNEVLGRSGEPLKVYTHYKNAWRARLTDAHVRAHPCEEYLHHLAKPPPAVRSHSWELEDLGFRKSDLEIPAGASAGRACFDRFLTRIGDYGKDRDYPAVDGVSRISVHLRFGTVSIRELVREALDQGTAGVRKWIDELIWREFYNMILHHYPHTQTRPFQSIYEGVAWRHDRAAFDAWCEGQTGYPIVDAAMRQLNTTGYMHNRLRMITANFLTKDLRIDWRWGERYFARRLLDFDLSQNLGGWQWSASIGTDAQPYFRIFNPVLQSEKFDADGAFIRRFVPELRNYPAGEIHAPWTVRPPVQRSYGCVIGRAYPAPIVDHGEARRAALEMFRRARPKAAPAGGRR